MTESTTPTPQTALERLQHWLGEQPHYELCTYYKANCTCGLDAARADLAEVSQAMRRSDITLTAHERIIEKATAAQQEAESQLAKLQEQNKRLVSRGFEDLHFENEQLKTQLAKLLERLGEWAKDDKWWEAHGLIDYDGTAIVRESTVRQSLLDLAAGGGEE